IDEVVGEHDGRVAQIDRVPQRHALGRAVVDELLELAGQRQAGDVDLADQVLVGHYLRGGHDAHRGGRDDGVEVGIGGDEAARFFRRFHRVVIAIDHGDEVDIGEFLGNGLLGRLDPGVLVGGGGGGREDGYVAAIGQVVGGQLDDGLADQIGVGRVEVQLAAFRRHA